MNTMPKSKVSSIKIGGQAGQGVKTSGIYFSKIASRSGYNIYNYIEYPSLIKGGHNVIQTTFSVDDVFSQIKEVNFLIALDQNTIEVHKDELISGAGVLYENEGKIDASSVGDKCKLFPVPLHKIAQEVGGAEIVANTVAMGATVYLMGGNLQHLLDLIHEDFSKSKPELVTINQKAAQAGFDYAKTNFPDGFDKLLAQVANTTPKILLNGNESVGLGAIAAGLQFISMYPMSPVSNLLNFLAENQKKYGYIVKQVEDEISAINMSIGASYAGARSMTSTSGGGFCLMTEGYGLAGMTEVPLVIVEGMRGGPATGLPTWSEQGDLRFVLHASQGEFPRIVLAAGDAKEAFYLTMVAFNLSEKYQTPVVVLIDKNICDHDQTFQVFDYSAYQVNRGKLVLDKLDEYNRYALTSDGVSPRTVPGSGNYFITNSDEHDEEGFDSEEISHRNSQMSKRLSKLSTCAQVDMPKPLIFGPESADITIVSWGSTKGPILESLKNFNNVNYLHLNWISPFPVEQVKDILTKSKYLLDIECNSSAQLAGLIKEHTGIDILDRLLKNDGRPFYPEEISAKINSILNRQ